ncbi:MAG: hypothetical protein WCP99_21010, partial [Burkholderiales bacterium]
RSVRLPVCPSARLSVCPSVRPVAGLPGFLASRRPGFTASLLPICLLAFLSDKSQHLSWQRVTAARD